MANGEQPPLREDDNNVRLTPGMLRILNRQVRLMLLSALYGRPAVSMVKLSVIQM